MKLHFISHIHLLKESRSKGKKKKLRSVKCVAKRGTGGGGCSGASTLQSPNAAGWAIQKSALVTGMQVILTIRRIWASRATGPLHASKLGFSEEIWGLSPTDSKSKNAGNYMHKIMRSKGSWDQHTGITGIPDWCCDSFLKHCPRGPGSWLNPDLESSGAYVRGWV